MWGSLGEGDGQFSGLNDVISTGQYLYVPDYENHRIQMFAADGDFIKTCGTGGDAQGQFNKPSFIYLLLKILVILHLDLAF